MSGAVALRMNRPANTDLTEQEWKVLTEAIWPAAKSADAVLMAVEYCRVRKLDPFKRPVHIVPMYNSLLKKMVETVWPGISELQTTAARTGAWAGMDAPVWSPMKTQTFSGVVGDDRRKIEVTVTFPEWGSVTVYRIVGGQRHAFSEPVFWLETYARIGRSDVPNDMWARRPLGQFHKCCKAASLRAAFPEETGNDYTAEEMEGKDTQGGVVIEGVVEAAPVEQPPPSERKRNYKEFLRDKLAASFDMNDIAKLREHVWVKDVCANSEEGRAYTEEQIATKVAKLSPDTVEHTPGPTLEEEFGEAVMG